LDARVRKLALLHNNSCSLGWSVAENTMVCRPMPGPGCSPDALASENGDQHLFEHLLPCMAQHVFFFIRQNHSDSSPLFNA
jgi:hypothetical protein